MPVESQTTQPTLNCRRGYQRGNGCDSPSFFFQSWRPRRGNALSALRPSRLLRTGRIVGSDDAGGLFIVSKSPQPL